MDKSRFIGRDFLKLSDFTPDKVLYMIDVSIDFKGRLRRREAHAIFPGCTAAALFEKKSTRTRTSFQAACAHLGMASVYMRPEEMRLGRGEPITDTARVIDCYCDVLFFRTFGQEIVQPFADYKESSVS
jgi:ornithine carbamoyltransferase